MKKIKLELLNNYIFALGIVGILLLQLPYIILGQDAVVTYHDQLDGDFLAYIYRAKYLLGGEKIFPEFLNGAATTALIAPAPLAILLFRIMSPFAAYVTMQTVGQLVAYIGMYLLCGKVTKKEYLRVGAGLLYALLPFLPVYGLSQYGAPMLLWCLVCLFRGEKVKVALVYVGIYAATSSLVLCGFTWIMLLGVWCVTLLFTKKLRKHVSLLYAFLELFLVYLLENATLIGQMLGIGEAPVSHKAEYVHQSSPFLSTFWDYFLCNDGHSVDYHIWFLPVVLFLLAIMLGRTLIAGDGFTENVSKQIKALHAILGLLVLFCLLAALWDSALFLPLRSKVGALGSFQINRVLWVAPALWLLTLVICLDIVLAQKGIWKICGYGLSLGFMALLGVLTLKDMPQRGSWQKLVTGDYTLISYRDYYAVGVLEQVEEYLRNTEGLEKKEYKVASLGIEPAAALYHGFYCVDGYSNNYDLQYKHAFREVIAPELERSDYLKEYYDDWGNRCYLFSAETPGYYTIEKNGFYFSNLQINTAALKQLGCDYILSAAYIANAENISLKLLREEPFETPESYYRIFLYKISVD